MFRLDSKSACHTDWLLTLESARARALPSNANRYSRALPSHCLSMVTECVQLLLAHDAAVDVKNLQGQTPLNEAISYGCRPTSTYLVFTSALFLRVIRVVLIK